MGSKTRHKPGWSCFVDRGGTFTDCVGVAANGEVRVAKVLSSEDSISRVLHEIARGEPISATTIATTVATNALLERKGARVGLVITEGFADLLAIGDQRRPRLFSPLVPRKAPLPVCTIEVKARLDRQGAVVMAPCPQDLTRITTQLSELELDAVVVSVVFGYRQPEFEQTIAGALANNLICPVISAAATVPRHGFLSRTETAVAEAYLQPVLAAHLRGPEIPCTALALRSNGTATPVPSLAATEAILSGPAGGAVAVARIREAESLGSVVGFDMGGTSTDVVFVDEALPLRYEVEIDELVIAAESVAIETVAAGGGSICRLQQRRAIVGPASVGADPGPLCFGAAAATEVSITDANVVLGRVDTSLFPFDVEMERAQQRFSTLAATVDTTAAEMAEGFVSVANAAMADAIRRVTVRQGKSAEGATMIAFGGAAAQHVCGVADELGIGRILVDPLASVLSASGVALAPRTEARQRDFGGATLEETFDNLQRTALDFARELGDGVIETVVALRYNGAGTSLMLPLADSLAGQHAAFSAEHETRYGFTQTDDVVCGMLRVTCRNDQQQQQELPAQAWPKVAEETVRLYANGCWHDAPKRAAKATPLAGPALVVGHGTTIFVAPGWQAQLTDSGRLALTTVTQRKLTPRIEAARLARFTGLFSSIAEQMGERLAEIAHSTNIRDRRDFSCGVFDADGRMVANAPHVPVHLGAMQDTVEAVLAAGVCPEETYVTNDPNLGGSHLPDITVVTPCFDGETLLGFVANRGHHADIGGRTPGSMSATSERLAEEGVVLPVTVVARNHQLQRELLSAALRNAPYPVRDVETNLADLAAQVAANRLGCQLLREASARFSSLQVPMEEVIDNAARETRAVIKNLADGAHQFASALDDGTKIAATVAVAGDQLCVDLRACGGTHAGSYNAPIAVVRSVVTYFLRCLSGADIPLNAGCLAHVNIEVGNGLIVSPPPDAAVACGNVETSQRLADVLFAAVGLMAPSQGTMNNVTIGDGSYGYYETLAGGSGASASADGPSAQQCHMTNTRATDIETVELRHPFRIVQFAIRQDSGGRGRYRGGDGLLRSYEFLAPATVTVIGQSRRVAPQGLLGGERGACGWQKVNDVAIDTTVEVATGDVLTVATPGGGGFGPLETS